MSCGFGVDSFLELWFIELFRCVQPRRDPRTNGNADVLVNQWLQTETLVCGSKLQKVCGYTRTKLTLNPLLSFTITDHFTIYRTAVS